MLNTASPKTNGYAVCTTDKLTATLHINKVTFETKECEHCGVGTPIAEIIK